MVEINDDINTKAEEAYKNEKWEEFRSELFSMIKELNPNATNNDIRKRVRKKKHSILYCVNLSLIMVNHLILVI